MLMIVVVARLGQALPHVCEAKDCRGSLSSSHRHIDCAWAYRNEKEVGDGIKQSGVDRKNIWVTSKLFEFHHSVSHCMEAASRAGKKNAKIAGGGNSAALVGTEQVC